MRYRSTERQKQKRCCGGRRELNQVLARTANSGERFWTSTEPTMDPTTTISGHLIVIVPDDWCLAGSATSRLGTTTRSVLPPYFHGLIIPIVGRRVRCTRHADVTGTRTANPALGVLFAHILEIALDIGAGDDIGIATPDIAEVVVVRAFVGIADAAFGDDGAEAV